MAYTENIATLTSAAALAANRIVTRDGNYAGTATLIAHGVTVRDCESGADVGVRLISGGSVIPVSCSEVITKGDLVTYSANGQINVRADTEKAVGIALTTSTAAQPVADIQFFGPQAPAVTT